MAMTLEEVRDQIASLEGDDSRRKAWVAAIDAHLAKFTPDWAGYRQGVLDGRRDAIEEAATGQSLGMVVYHDDERAAARLEGQRVLIVPLPTPPTDGEG